MYKINDDKSIYVTRGDIVALEVSAKDTTKTLGTPYTFQPGEILRMTVYGKKKAQNVVLQKDFPITAVTQTVGIFLTKEDTKIGDIISKPVDYWYEIELNPYDNPQTIIGYDDDGAKVFKLFPEGADKELEEYEPNEDDILARFLDDELDLTSKHPVENQAIARAFANLQGGFKATQEAVTKLHVTPEMYGAIGDGKADDTEALQSCLVSGNRITLNGTYRITSRLNFSGLKDVVLQGGKIVRDKDTTFCTIKGGSCSNIHIVNVEFDGNGNNPDMEYKWSDETQICIFLAGDCHDIFVEKCVIKNHNYGVFTLGANFTEGIVSANATIRDCRFENCCSCIDTYGKGILIDHNTFMNITGNAIQIEPEGGQSAANPLEDKDYYQCAMGSVISNNLLTNVEGTAIVIHDNAYGISIDNNTIVDFTNAINANRAHKGCFVTNNTIIYQKTVDVNSDKRPWDLSYFAVYCGNNSVVKNNYLENCYTAIQGREGSTIEGNTIVSPFVSAIAVSSSDATLMHYISDNIVKKFVRNTAAWWGAYPIVLNGGKAIVNGNVVYSDCEPICNNNCAASVNRLLSTTKQTTAITALELNEYSN